MTNPTGQGSTNPSFVNDQGDQGDPHNIYSSLGLVSAMLGAATGENVDQGGLPPDVLRMLLAHVQTAGAGAVGQSGGNAYPTIISGNPPITTQPQSQAAAGGGGLAAGLSAFESATNSISNVALALSNLISSTMQQSQEGASDSNPASNATMTVAGLIYTAATSKAARTTGQFCYQECSDKCAGNCGGPGCGCTNGEWGCGGFGSCFCRWWGMICGANNNLKERLEDLEQRYGKAVLLIALSNLRIDVVEVLSGQGSINLPPIEEIEEACNRVSLDFVEILQHESDQAWLEAFTNGNEVLSSLFWRDCIVRALVDSSVAFDENLLTETVLVTTPLSGEMLACAPFELIKVAQALPRIKVHSSQDSSSRNLGVMQVADLTQKVAKVLFNATGGGVRPIWISKEQLMSIISIVIAQSGYNLAALPGEANLPIFQDMKDLLEETCKKKLEKAQGGAEKERREGVVQKFFEIANRCCEKERRRSTILQNPHNVQARDELILKMSQSWLAAAGIRTNAPSRGTTPAVSLLATPRISPPTTPGSPPSGTIGSHWSCPAISQQPSSESPPSDTSSTRGGEVVSLALRRLQWTSGHHNQTFDEEDC